MVVKINFVPTGFITAQNGIEKVIRQHIIDSKWRGVISMPSNILQIQVQTIRFIY